MSLFLIFEHLDQTINRSSEQTPLNDVSVDIDVPVSGQRGDVTQQSSKAGNHQGQFRMHCKMVGTQNVIAKLPKALDRSLANTEYHLQFVS